MTDYHFTPFLWCNPACSVNLARGNQLCINEALYSPRTESVNVVLSKSKYVGPEPGINTKDFTTPLTPISNNIVYARSLNSCRGPILSYRTIRGKWVHLR